MRTSDMTYGRLSDTGSGTIVVAAHPPRRRGALEELRAVLVEHSLGCGWHFPFDVASEVDLAVDPRSNQGMAVDLCEFRDWFMSEVHTWFS